MVTVSPPVSPSVVARILTIQKPSVTAGTLLSTARAPSAGSEGEEDRGIPGVPVGLCCVLHRRAEVAQQVVMIAQIVFHTRAQSRVAAAAHAIGCLVEDFAAQLQIGQQLVGHGPTDQAEIARGAAAVEHTTAAA